MAYAFVNMFLLVSMLHVTFSLRFNSTYGFKVNFMRKAVEIAEEVAKSATTNVLINNETFDEGDAVDYLISKNKGNPFILLDGHIDKYKVRENSVCIIMILENGALRRFARKLSIVSNNTYDFWKNKELTVMVTIILKPIKETHLKDMFKLAWKEDMINSVILHSNEGKEVKMLTYNPFNDSLYEVNAKNLKKTFFRKLKNLYGRELNIALYSQTPLNIYIDGEYTGVEASAMTDFVKWLNATPIVIDFPTTGDFNPYGYTVLRNQLLGLMLDYAIKLTDVSFNKRYSNSTPYHVNVYPYEMCAYSILMPKKPVSEFFALMEVFAVETWIMSFAAMIVAILTLSAIRNWRYNCRTALEVYAMYFLQFPMNHSKFTNKERLLHFFILWFVKCLDDYYTSNLIGHLTVQNYRVAPKTIEEFGKTHLGLVIQEPLTAYIHSFGDELNNILYHHYVIKTTEEMNEMLSNADTKFAYAIENWKAAFYLREYRNRGINNFVLLEESLWQMPMGYTSAAGSPYHDIMNYHFIAMHENGIYNYWSSYLTSTKPSVVISRVSLKLIHFGMLYIAYGVGVTLAILTFIAELYWHRRRSIKP